MTKLQSLLLPCLLLLLTPPTANANIMSYRPTGFLSGPRGALCKKLTSLLSKSQPVFPSSLLPFPAMTAFTTTNPTTTATTTAAAAAATGGNNPVTSSSSSWSSRAVDARRSLSRLALITLPDFAAHSSNVFTGLGTNTALALFGLAVKQKWLTSSGLLHAWILGVALWSTLGWRGWAVCVLYLIFGSLVTKVKQAEKEALGIAEKRGGARGPENVWGSAAAVSI